MHKGGRGEKMGGKKGRLILAIIETHLNSPGAFRAAARALCLKYSLSVYQGVRDTVSLCKI